MPIVWRNSTCRKVGFIYRVERGQKYMSLRKLFELADVLDVTFCFFANFK